MLGKGLIDGQCFVGRHRSVTVGVESREKTGFELLHHVRGNSRELTAGDGAVTVEIILRQRAEMVGAEQVRVYEIRAADVGAAQAERTRTGNDFGCA